jgi:arginine decarboxylase
MGAGLDTIDIGGGMGVDYDGQPVRVVERINYTINGVRRGRGVPHQERLRRCGVPHPRILSESGRAMVAYSSVLIFDVLGKSKFASDPGHRGDRRRCLQAEGEPPQPVIDLIDAFEA